MRLMHIRDLSPELKKIKGVLLAKNLRQLLVQSRREVGRLRRSMFRDTFVNEAISQESIGRKTETRKMSSFFSLILLLREYDWTANNDRRPSREALLSIESATQFDDEAPKLTDECSFPQALLAV